MVKGMEGHVIICGYGVVGQKIAEQLSEHNVSFVIIDTDQGKVDTLTEQGYNVVRGDATRSNVLKSAGLETAKAIAAVLDEDAKNLFIVITARDIRKDIVIASRANDEFVREKLIEAGANHIVMPQITASKEIIREILKTRSR